MASTTFTYGNMSGISGLTANSVLTTNGTGTLSWANTGATTYTVAADPNLKGASLQVNGDAEFKGDVKVKGKSLSELIENIEKRLAILHPNEALEEKWEKLKTLGEQYREMEKEILHAEEMWKILKK
jgi:hypothetical protein